MISDALPLVEDRHKPCFAAQRRHGTDGNNILKLQQRMFIETPHNFSGIQRGTAANGHYPVRFKGQHRFGSAPDGFNGRIGFNIIDNNALHTRFIEFADGFIQKAKTLH